MGQDGSQINNYYLWLRQIPSGKIQQILLGASLVTWFIIFSLQIWKYLFMLLDFDPLGERNHS